MVRTWQRLVVSAALALVALGCLVKDDIATWYLEPAGGVTWSILEKDVHSDAEDVNDRQAEEAAYLSAVRGLTHPVARGFAELRPVEVKTRILRGTSPFAVATDARFASIGTLGQELIVRAGLSGESSLTRGPEGVTWTLSVRDPHAPGAADPDDDLTALGAGLDQLKVMLVDGRFVAAEGFRVSGDHRSAVLIERDDNVFKDGATYVLKLTWK